MNKFLSLLGIGAIALCSACSSDSPENPSGNGNGNGNGGVTPSLEPASLNLTSAEKDIVSGLNSFSDKLIDEASKESLNGNFNISPLSVSMYLGLLANSCQGETHNQIVDALGQSDIQALNNVCKRLVEYLPSEKTGSKMAIANHIWVANRYTIPTDYQSLMTSVFGDVVENVDFTKPTTVPGINKWISNNTNGLIPTMLDGEWYEYTDTKVAMANTVYFMGKWAKEFDPTNTKKQVFHAADGDTHVDMMHMNALLSYAKNDVAEKVTLNFTGHVNSLEIYLPVNATAAKDVTTLINSDVRNNLKNSTAECNVTLSLPKFSVTHNSSLNAALNSLGITSLDNVNLSPLGVNESIPTTITHKTVIKVDEKGAELAALTSGIFGSNLDPDAPKNVTMTVDRPFMYIVRNNETNAILMAGVVANPK